MERIAHRGAKRELPENSLDAFQRAFERGADAVELDVHGTSDGVVVVHHDTTLGSVAGPLRGRPIARLTATELASVELGPRIGIPTLSAVLAATPPNRRVYVEIKGPGIERAVADLIGAADRDCAVHSFDHDMIARMRAIAPAIPRGILFEEPDVDLEAVAERTRARDVWPHYRLIDGPMVERIHGLGCRAIAWTVNSRDVAMDLIALGVEGLCGDDVRVFPEP